MQATLPTHLLKLGCLSPKGPRLFALIIPCMFRALCWQHALPVCRPQPRHFQTDAVLGGESTWMLAGRLLKLVSGFPAHGTVSCLASMLLVQQANLLNQQQGSPGLPSGWDEQDMLLFTRPRPPKSWSSVLMMHCHLPPSGTPACRPSGTLATATQHLL